MPSEPTAFEPDGHDDGGRACSERICGIVASIALLSFSALYLLEATSYRLGSLAEPGPALFPIVVSALLIVAGAGMFVEGVRTPRDATVRWPRLPFVLRLVLVLVGSAAYLFLLPTLGQFLAGVLLCATLLVGMRMRRWWLIVILSIVISGAVQVLFGTLLNVPLPHGLISF